MPKENSGENVKEEALKTVAKGGGFMFFGVVISRILGYFTRIFLARGLGPSGYGLIFLGLSIYGIAKNFGILGLPKAIMKYVPSYMEKGEENKARGVLISSLKLSLPLSILVCVTLLLLAPFISIWIFGNEELIPIIRILAIAIPFTTTFNIFSSGIKAFKQMKYFSLVSRIAQPSLKLAFIALFLYLGLGALGGTLGYALGFMGASILSFHILQNRIFPLIKPNIKEFKVKRKLLFFSWPIMFSTLIFTFMGKIDNLMIGWLLKSTSKVGIYQAAFPIARLMIIFSAILGPLFLPIISELDSKGKEKKTEEFYSTIEKWIFYLALPFFLLFVLFPDAFLNVLFGQEYIDGGTVLSILSLGFLIHILGTIASDFISLSEKTKFYLYNVLIAITFNITLDLYLIPTHGIKGAALATTFTLTLLAFLRFFEAWKFYDAFPFNYNFLKAPLAALISGSLIYYLSNILFTGLGILPLIGLFFLYFPFYGLIILLLRGLDQNDLLILRAAERRTGLKIKFLRDLVKKFT